MQKELLERVVDKRASSWDSKESEKNKLSLKIKYRRKEPMVEIDKWNYAKSHVKSTQLKVRLQKKKTVRKLIFYDD